MIFRMKRELIERRRMKKETTTSVTYFHKYCALLDKQIYLFIFPFMYIFKSGLAANECYQSLKLTKKLVDSSA